MKNLLLSISFFTSFFISCFAYGQLTEKRLGTTPSTMGYIEFLPSSYSNTSSTKLPVIIFFHGSGESGNGTTELSKIYITGLPKIIKNNSWTYKTQFVVLMPQHDPSRGLCMTANEIRDFIDFARQKYNVDPSRVYLTGLSCGANGLWRYLGSNPSNAKVAAAVPISGNGKSAYDSAGCGIEVPTWAFHGSEDKISLASNDIAANNLFQQCPAPHAEVKFTLYQGVDHNAWDRTYDLSANNDIYAWMLTKRSPSANQAPTDITLSSTEVNENQPVGTVVGTFTTTDPDAGNTFIYTLELAGTNNDKNSFTIDGNKLKTNEVFNYATKSNYRIKVRSTDQGGLYDENWFDYIKVIKGGVVSASLPPEDGGDLSKVTIYPNPANNQVNIDWAVSSLENADITVISVTGQTVIHQNFTKRSPLLLKTQSLNVGIYTIFLRSDKYVINKKLIISR